MGDAEWTGFSGHTEAILLSCTGTADVPIRVVRAPVQATNPQTGGRTDGSAPRRLRRFPNRTPPPRSSGTMPGDQRMALRVAPLFFR